MKNKSILYRFGLVVLVVLLLVLILPSSKIDLASKISASTQASVRAEHQQNFASSNEMEFEFIPVRMRSIRTFRKCFPACAVSDGSARTIPPTPTNFRWIPSP